MLKPIGHKGLLEGKSRGHIITFDDGQDYVVKFVRDGFEKILPNEWIAYCLARFLGLPIPYSRMVEVPEEFFIGIADTSQERYTPRQFASVCIPDCVSLHQVSAVESVINHSSLAGIILLDYWLCNQDRNRSNVLLREEQTGVYRMWMIDHGDSFGSYFWTTADLRRPSIKLYKSMTHQFMAQFVQTEQEFAEYMNIIRTIPRLLIEEIVAIIPNEWNISDEERDAIVKQLLYRRDKQLASLVRKFIEKVYRTQRVVSE